MSLIGLLGNLAGSAAYPLPASMEPSIDKAHEKNTFFKLICMGLTFIDQVDS
jgi:hypothetical protein